MSYDPNQSNNPESTPPPPNENPNAGYPIPPHPGYGYPPQPDGQPNPGYGYPPQPQPGYGYPPQPPFPPYPGTGFDGPPAQPLPLDEAIKQLPKQYLKILTKPGAATFAQEKGKAAWNIIWVQLAIVAVLGGLLTAASLAFTLPMTLSSMSMNTPGMNTPGMNTSRIIELYQSLALPIGLGSIILSPIGFFIGSGIYFGIAKAFKGQGTFKEQMYSTLIFQVPMTIISGLISLIPLVGSYATAAIGIYAIVLQVYMNMGVHRLRGGRATLVVLLLPIIALLLACILSVAIGVFIASTINHPTN